MATLPLDVARCHGLIDTDGTKLALCETCERHKNATNGGIRTPWINPGVNVVHVTDGRIECRVRLPAEG